MAEPLSREQLARIDAYWRASNYLAPGPIHLYDNPLLRVPVAADYHGYPWLIHRLTYRRTNHANLHVRGYKEEGTITTPFDMAVLNDLDRFHLAGDAVDRLPQLASRAVYLKQAMRDKLVEHREYIVRYGEDMPEIREWRWGMTG